ncbi:MAG: PspC domain-containing protein [Pseudomonadota bacterium]
MRYGRGSGRIYRDRENGVLFGVCAGLANHFAVRPLAIRILVVLAVVIAPFWPLALVYLTAGILLQDRPLEYTGRRSEREFWRDGEEESWR